MPLPSSEVKATVTPIARLQKREKTVKGLKRSQMERKPSTLKQAPLGHASVEQKEKVLREGLRFETKDTFDGGRLEPAHVVPRPHGGCNHEDCVCPLTHLQHERYDRGELSILEHLTLAEQSHAVGHVGILGVLKRTTGETYVPERLLRVVSDDGEQD
jgi:hypothetical protein